MDSPKWDHGVCVAVMRTLGDQRVAADKPLFTDDAISWLAKVVADNWDALPMQHRSALISVGGLIAAQQMREMEAQDLADGLLNQLREDGRHG